MNNIMIFAFDTVIDNKVFYNYIWEQFYKLVFLKGYKYVIIDISRVRMVKAEVLPKLCCLGQIAKKKGVQIEINLNPASDVKDFLGTINFFDIVHKKDIFILNDGQTGGKHKEDKVTKTFLCFNQNLVNKYERKYNFGNMPEAEKLKHCIAAEIIGERHLTNPGEITEDMIKKSPVLSVMDNICKRKYNKNEILMQFALDFTELIHNAVWHGRTSGFFSAQAGTYGDSNFRRVDICISDCGMGLYETLAHKDWKKEQKKTYTIPLEQFLSLKSEKQKNFYSMLEMIFFRSEDGERGIYDIMKNLIDKKNLRINIINGNTQLFLKRENQKASRAVLQELLLNKHYNNFSTYNKAPIGYGFSMDISFEF